METIAINDFARRRHVASERYSHYEGTEAQLLELVQSCLPSRRPGYRPGVWLVPVPPAGFRSAVACIRPGMWLEARFDARSKDEAPYAKVVVLGEKVAAVGVDIVVYEHDVLGADSSTDAALEVVSINARASDGPEPMSPMAMARNFLGLTGGTPAAYTAQEFAESIAYWSDKAMIEPPGR